VSEALNAAGVLKPLLQSGLPDLFTVHGDPEKLLALQGLDATGIVASISQRFPDLLDVSRPALKVVA
jgi:1-deoxy-D-xylulose-5-phosphate synthase